MSVTAAASAFFVFMIVAAAASAFVVMSMTAAASTADRVENNEFIIDHVNDQIFDCVCGFFRNYHLDAVEFLRLVVFVKSSELENRVFAAAGFLDLYQQAIRLLFGKNLLQSVACAVCNFHDCIPPDLLSL